MRLKWMLIFLIIPLIIGADIIEIEKPVIENQSFRNELPRMLIPGQPSMPYVPVKILLPMGEKLSSMEVVLKNQAETIVNVQIEYSRKAQPISLSTADNTIKDNSVYSCNEFFPKMDHKILGTQRLNGYDLLLVNVYPYKFNPVTNEVIWFENAEIVLHTELDEEIFQQQDKMLLGNGSRIGSKLENLVINPENISTYRKHTSSSSRSLVSPDEPFKMIIITDAERLPYFDDFIDWKNDHGIQTGIFLTSDIYAEYTGIDNPEKIKNFIDDAYTVYSATATPLEYVLLGGDDEIIPIRFVFIDTGYGTVDYHMPCDLYYGCLDNNWDGNGNGVYGEIADNVDMVPDISIGRIPAETETEFFHFFHKTYTYVDGASVSNDIAYMVGENLNWSPVTWGGDYKDEILSLVPNLNDDYHVFKLYDREGSYSPQAVKEAINNGVSIINHMGHSNESIVFGQNGGQISSYTNTEYGFAYSQGCYPAAFDEATSQTSESVAENLVFSEFGLFAFVGNTRYGWYSPGSTNGPSQPYDIEFFKAIFSNDIRQLGKALSESRIVLANEAISNAFLRWVHYELVLFGDPSVSVKYAYGTFPFIQPVEAVYDDSQTGDGDFIPNPGEEIEIYIELENLEGWADATDVSATISFEDSAIQVITGSVFYGDIQSGESVNSSPFVVQIPQDCNYGSYEYVVEITAPVSGEVNFERSYPLSFEVSLFQNNWPWTTSNAILSNPVIIDFNEDGIKDVLISDANANIHLLNINAGTIPGFPWTNNESIWKSTAVGDINNDGSTDIVIASRNSRIFALDNSGNEIFSFETFSDQLLTPIISDIDGDNQQDIVSFGTDKNLIVLNSSGEMLINFPVELSGQCFKEMASADLDQDGANEVLIGSLDGKLNVIDHNGENISGFPLEFNSPVCSAPIVLDNYKIAIGTDDNKIHIINATGDILLSKDIDSKIACSPIAADFDNDEELDIAFATISGSLYIIHQDGTDLNGWPVNIGNSITNPPLAVDINNDDNINLVCFTSTNDLYVFHNNGSEVDFSPVPVGLIGNTPSTIDDIDWDGDFDIVSGISVGAFIIDCKLQKGSMIPWNTYRGNYRRTGFYGDNELFTGTDEIIPQIAKSKLNQNYPNPFNPTTTISFNISSKDAKNTKLIIYNIKGQKVKTLLNEHLAKGEHSVVWNGKDDSGKSVSSGIYFYKLSVENKTINVMKCLLLK
ncbi:MAG: FG-GAP-like repeat-containing protein [Candidatus Cloacimonetes bacterium]|nr:FG-GAP-like repeat-containing protein [Candidatus Cloacimonadota bacterium]